MRTLIFALTLMVAGFGVAAAQTPASPAPPQCPADSARRVQAYLDHPLADVMDTLGGIYRDCETALGDGDAARAAYAPSDTGAPVTEGTMAALRAMTAQAHAQREESCNADDPARCALDTRIDQRAQEAVHSAEALHTAYGDNPAAATLPAGIVDLDEYDIDLTPRRRLTLAGGRQMRDIFIGQSPTEISETGDGPPMLAAISACAYVFTGQTYASDCGISPQDARTPAWNVRCDARCAQRAADMAEALPRAVATRSLYGVVGADTLMRHEAELDAQNEAEWRSYFFGAGQSRVQWPWELMINGRRYRAEENESEAGRFSPPTDQLIVMHPGVGATFYDGDDSEVKLTALAELVGYSRWEYREGQRHNEWGASLIAAYTPGDAGDDWGYGVMVRTPYRGLNIAWVRREGANGEDEDGFMFSMKVGDLLNGAATQGLCEGFGVHVPGLCPAS